MPSSAPAVAISTVELTRRYGVFVGSCIFSTFSLFIACIVKTRERFMGIGQVLTMPLFFASSTLYPVQLMPGWLQALAAANPLTYLVDALRGSTIVGGTSVHAHGTSFGVMLLVFALLLALASKLYPGLARWPPDPLRRRCCAAQILC